MVIKDIEKLTKQNANYRKVLVTGKYSQIVAMCIPAKVDIGEEVHNLADQILFIVEGEGRATLNEVEKNISAGDVVFVTAGVKHNITNIGQKDLKLFTIYAPPEHPEGTVEKEKIVKEESDHEK